MHGADGPTGDELERTAGQAWFAGGLFVGFGAAPLVALVIYGIASRFFESSLAALVVLAAALVSFALGLAYIALARTLEE
ncbi:hypothetical protein [Natrononativus amylolyticus]|uniref:hypothetical protein n=1 Tax=Natrononativus amylolyticus TaxID=2963434 RepID=UPI0020CDEC4A|nr:hypothetical protein [Natrononativus amylolyticus]